MWAQLRLWVAAAGAAVFAVLAGLLHLRTTQRDRARAEAGRERERAQASEAATAQRRRADDASNAAKTKGDHDVKEAVDRARSGVRDHFEQ